MAFRGIPAEVLDFYERLEADNTKAFWAANKQVHRDVVAATTLELTEALDQVQL